mmetsp:Transcript_4782/g.30279  ORF Transcript_4782/g.30279 Transcript_4782/m.30279 type:complete len:122 (+) Transcript_4782:368-733(+)
MGFEVQNLRLPQHWSITWELCFYVLKGFEGILFTDWCGHATYEIQWLHNVTSTLPKGLSFHPQRLSPPNPVFAREESWQNNQKRHRTLHQRTLMGKLRVCETGRRLDWLYEGRINVIIPFC